MATKTVINTTTTTTTTNIIPPVIQRGISIIIDQDQSQNQQQQQQYNVVGNASNSSKSVEVSIHHDDMSPKISARSTKTFIDINCNNVNNNTNGHYDLNDNDHNDDVKETGYTTITNHRNSSNNCKHNNNNNESQITFPHFTQMQSGFGEKRKLALTVVGEKEDIAKPTKQTSNGHHTVDDDDDDDDEDDDDVGLVGETPTQVGNVVAPIDVGVSVSGTSGESTIIQHTNGTNTVSSNNNNKNTKNDIVHVDDGAKKVLDACLKTTIIQCNVENDHENVINIQSKDNDNGDHYDDDDDDESRNSDGVRIGVGVGDDGQQFFCSNGLRIVDASRRKHHQLQLNDIRTASDCNSLSKKADCASATEHTKKNRATTTHVVKIQIQPNATDLVNGGGNSKTTDKQVTVVQVNENPLKSLQNPSELNLNLNLNLNLMKMVQKSPINHNGIQQSGNTTVTELNVTNPAYLYYTMSSGQFSPCDTLDSGTGSDLESNGGVAGTPSQASSKDIVQDAHQNDDDIIAKENNNNNSKNNITSSKLELHLKTTKIRVSNAGNGTTEHQRAGSLTDSEESESSSSLSCDSLHSMTTTTTTEYIRQCSASPSGGKKSTNLSSGSASASASVKRLSSYLPDSLLRDIRDRKFPTNDFEIKYGDHHHSQDDDEDDTVKSDDAQKIAAEAAEHAKFLQECNARDNEFNDKKQRISLPPPGKAFILDTENGTFVDTKMNSMPRKYEADKYYNFHVNEHENFHSFHGHRHGNGSDVGLYNGKADEQQQQHHNHHHNNDDETSLLEYDLKSVLQRDDDFAGFKDIRCSSTTSTIRSSKGTVRGVKNRVRNGIATFLQMQQPHVKNYLEKDLGKVVLYTTSMGIIRDTYAKCSNVKQILRTLLVKFEERDVFMSVEYQVEIKNRMHTDVIRVPQLFVEGQHIGDAETVERLNESGELRQLLKPYKSIATAYTCQTCGGYRLLPCPSCNGSKKSVHRNHFTAEFVALKCMNCDEVGLVKCHNC